MSIQYIILLVVWLLPSILVTIFLAKRDDLEKSQKLAQIVIAWLIPVLAPIGLRLLYRSADEDFKPTESAFGGGDSGDKVS